jgi:hypothetical protein
MGDVKVKQDERDTRHEPNPSARRDMPGESHDDLVKREPDPDEAPPKGYQDAERTPRDQGGIAD